MHLRTLLSTPAQSSDAQKNRTTAWFGIGLLRAQGRVVNAKYRVLIPSNTDVLVKVWYQGHQPWYYPGTIDKTQSQPLNLKPGEEKELDIRLEPDPNAPPERCGMPVGSVVKECCPSGECPISGV